MDISNGKSPVLYIVGCGGYPSEDMPDTVKRAQTDGWEVCVIATRMGSRFLDVPRLRDLTGHPVRDDYKQPDEPDVLPAADAYLVAPATFNTINKVAGGISDTLALGLLNEAIGFRKPLIFAPWPNKMLAQHPAFPRSIQTLRDAGVRFILDYDNLPVPSSGRPGAAAFPWETIHSELANVRRSLGA